MITAVQRKLQFISEGAAVQRFHTRPLLRPESDGQHSHEVAMIAEILSGGSVEGCPKASPVLLMACLSHDLGEQKTSDVSAPAKRLLDIRDQLQTMEDLACAEHGLDFCRYLTEAEYRVLKMADMFSGMLCCCRELALGNRNVLLMWRRWNEWVHTDFLHDMRPLELEVYNAILAIRAEIESVEGPNFDVYTTIV